jgi:hypothetical protein
VRLSSQGVYARLLTIRQIILYRLDHNFAELAAVKDDPAPAKIWKPIVKKVGVEKLEEL